MAKFVPQAEMSVSEQAQVRRDKLAALRVEGRDPFVQTKFDFTADSAAIKADYEGYEGELSERPYTNVAEPGETWKGGNTIKFGAALDK